MASGTFRPASLTSSDMWAVASEPDNVSGYLVIWVGREGGDGGCTERPVDSRDLPDHYAEPHARPATLVRPLGKHGLGASMGRHGPEDDDDDGP
jgi:hypothetical protein